MKEEHAIAKGCTVIKHTHICRIKNYTGGCSEDTAKIELTT